MMHANKINFFLSFEKCRPHLGGFNKKKSVVPKTYFNWTGRRITFVKK